MNAEKRKPVIFFFERPKQHPKQTLNLTVRALASKSIVHDSPLYYKRSILGKMKGETWSDMKTMPLINEMTF